MLFEACERSNLRHSVPFEGLGIAGAVHLKMSYLIDTYRFTCYLILYTCAEKSQISNLSCFFQGTPFSYSFLFIYIYIYDY